MSVVTLDSYDEVSQMAARHVARRLLQTRDSSIALPAGQTPVGLYRRLIQFYEDGLLTFDSVVCFGLDEYLGIAPDHPQSFHRFLHDQFFDHVDLTANQVFTLDGSTSDPEGECAEFERSIAQHTLDMAVLGIGPNGHIAFNEPGSDWGARTRVVQLDEATLESIRQDFHPDEAPSQGLTMGIETIMHASEVLLLASGSRKAEPLRQAMTGPISSEVPASVLRLHPNATLYADREAFPPNDWEDSHVNVA